VFYYDLGSDKRLGDIVFAGSHDASITSGGAHAKTQTHDLMLQAIAGVRLFDLRIMASRTASGGLSLVGYHGKKKNKGVIDKVRSKISGKTFDGVEVRKIRFGAEGERLATMLEQAREFVEKTPEFLILKFGKCTNYPVIADHCATILGKRMFTWNGIEFSKLTLGDLKHKVVCVFDEPGARQITDMGPRDGILKFRSLKGGDDDGGVGDAYDARFEGMQYVGKGGTDEKAVWRTKAMKMRENVSKQGKLMGLGTGSAHDDAANVLGMMYWTSTGSVSSIKARDKVMWGKTGVERMHDLWSDALENAVGTEMRRDHVKYMDYGGQRRLKAFIPNIVMIDFADPAKCKTIYQLNTLAEQRLQEAYQACVDAGYA
jgi:hypothetical protein